MWQRGVFDFLGGRAAPVTKEAFMNIKSINKKLAERFGGAVSAREADGVVTLTGELADWGDVVAACAMCADDRSRWRVVNDIRFTGGEIPPMRLPRLSDGALEGLRPDALVIGGGISGASIARELTRYNISVLLVDKEGDLAMHASSRNDGQVHVGVDLRPGTLKHKYVLRGSAMFDKVCAELGVPFERVGQVVGLYSAWLWPFALVFALVRRLQGVKDTSVISRKRLRELEPNINPEFKLALYNPNAGIVCPYGLTIAYAENAVENGARVELNAAVVGMEVENGVITAVRTNRGDIFPRVVVNAAGVFAEDAARMAGDRFYSIHPRAGTNSILDKKRGSLIRGVAAVKNLKQRTPAHTKGGGLVHTADGNLLAGPDARETYLKEDFSTSQDCIDRVFAKQRGTAPELSERDIIASFTGVRACTFEEDFIIERGRKTRNLVHCAGIQSPGLTTAPAAALDVTELVVGILRESGLEVSHNADFNPRRVAIPRVRELPERERAELISQNPDYGEIVCRCEEISRGEIIDALERPIRVATTDGVKRRVRPGMGRCQGGFCLPLVMEIIAEHEGIALRAVEKRAGAPIAFGDTRGCGE